MEDVDYTFPQYRIDLPPGLMEQAVGMVPRLLKEVGFQVNNPRFLSHLAKKKGIQIDGSRVYFEQNLVRKYIDAFIARKKAELETIAKPTSQEKEWTVTTEGYSMMVIDVGTDRLRPATCQDLRDLIHLANSFGVGGNYMVMPQDV